MYIIHNQFLFVAVCDELAIIANGMIVYTDDITAPYDIGTLATYSCNPGFVLSGENVQRTCMNAGDGIGGRFDGVAPTSCIRTCKQGRQLLRPSFI